MVPPDARAPSRQTLRRRPAEWAVFSRSPEDTDRLGRRLGRALRGGEILALSGDLGAGKTALVRGIAAGLGAPPRSVSSPTFVLVQEYAGRLRLLHADLYRIAGPEEAAELGLAQELDERTALAVEWAERAGNELGDDRLEIHLRHRGPRSRDVSFHGTGPLALACLARLRRAGSRRGSARGPGGRRASP